MKKLLSSILIFFLLTPPVFATTIFMESGGDATQGTDFYSSVSGSVTADTTHPRTGPRSIKLPTGNTFARTGSIAGGSAPYARRFHYTFYTDTWTAATAPQNFRILQSGATSMTIKRSTVVDGALAITVNGLSDAVGTTVLTANTFHQIDFSYNVQSATVFTIKLYLDGVLQASDINNGTLGRPTLDQVDFQNQGAGNYWFDDYYVDDGTGSDPVGDIRVTAKLPFANGTTNGFGTNGSGSGYGTGNARFVNDRATSTADSVSFLGLGSAVTEEYNIEPRQTGDVNMFGKTIVDSAGWIFAKVAAGTEAAQLILDGVNNAKTITTTPTLYTAYAGKTSYAAGTGADIGVITDTSLTTMTVYEAGILYAFKFPSFNPWHFWYF